jgi:hypothetical protein
MKLPLPLLLVCAGSVAMGAIAGITRATGSTPAPASTQNHFAAPQPNPPGMIPTSTSAPTFAPAPAPAAQTASAPNLPALTISACNGSPSDANVRSSPNGGIVGYVPAGQSVFMTGRTSGDWHEVEAPSLILDPGQSTPKSGWISGCFVP